MYKKNAIQKNTINNSQNERGCLRLRAGLAPAFPPFGQSRAKS
jgi:hypothetical protein